MCQTHTHVGAKKSAVMPSPKPTAKPVEPRRDQAKLPPPPVQHRDVDLSSTRGPNIDRRPPPSIDKRPNVAPQQPVPRKLESAKPATPAAPVAKSAPVTNVTTPQPIPAATVKKVESVAVPPAAPRVETPAPSQSQPKPIPAVALVELRADMAEHHITRARLILESAAREEKSVDNKNRARWQGDVVARLHVSLFGGNQPAAMEAIRPKSGMLENVRSGAMQLFGGSIESGALTPPEFLRLKPR